MNAVMPARTITSSAPAPSVALIVEWLREISENGSAPAAILLASLIVSCCWPMPVIIAGAEHTRGVDFQFVGTRVMLTMLLPLIMALLAQRYIVRGLALGAVKG